MASTGIISLVLLYQAGTIFSTIRLQEHFRWSSLDYAYPDNNERIQALLSGKFRPENNLPVGIEIWKDKLFVTVPRWRTGIPSTLNYVKLTSAPGPTSPVLIPYPSWEANTLGDCENGLSTVYRIEADQCNRLWVLDAGTFGIDNTTQQLCPFTVNVFDLNTDRRIRRYPIPSDQTTDRTFIANIALDLDTGCDDAYAYFSDELDYGLIVYSLKENRSWRFTHSYFMPDPLAGDFTIDGINFQWGTEGIFGMSLTNGILYFGPLASFREFAVSTSILRNSTKIEDSFRDFVALSERGPRTHATSRTMTPEGIQFLGFIDQNAIACWDSQKPYGPQTVQIVDMDEEQLIFPADVKIDKSGNLWAISDKMSTFLYSQLDYNDINFRVFFAPVEVLIRGTVCEQNAISLPKFTKPNNFFINHAFHHKQHNFLL